MDAGSPLGVKARAALALAVCLPLFPASPAAARRVRIYGPKIISRDTPLAESCDGLRQETDTMVAADPLERAAWWPPGTRTTTGAVSWPPRETEAGPGSSPPSRASPSARGGRLGRGCGPLGVHRPKGRRV